MTLIIRVSETAGLRPVYSVGWIMCLYVEVYVALAWSVLWPETDGRGLSIFTIRSV